MAVRMPTPSAKPANLEQKAAAFIERAWKPKGQPVGGRTYITMRMDNDLLEKLQVEAKRKGLTRSAFISFAVAKAIEAEHRVGE